MGKNILKRSLLVGIVFLFLSTACLPVLASEGKPDLVVTRIRPDFHDAPVTTGIACEVRNIGDAPAVGSIDVRLIVRKGIFGFIPVYNKMSSETTDGLNPGDKMIITFSYIPNSIGFYKFKTDINVDNKIDESNSFNNIHRTFYFITSPEDAFFGWWGLG